MATNRGRSGSLERRPSTGAKAAKATRESAWREGDNEKRALLAEEGAALGSEQAPEGPSAGAQGGGEAGESKKKWGGTGMREGGEWKELVSKAKDVGRGWKRIWDNEGLAGTTAHLRSTPLRSSLSSLGAAISATLSFIPPRRRTPVAFIAALILFFLLFLRPHSHPPSNPKRALAILQDSAAAGAIVDRTTGLHRGQNKAKVLEGFSNPYGFISLVDPYAGGVFNPSILVLPDAVGAGFHHLVVARGPERFEVIDKEDTRWQTVLACFLLPMKRKYLELPYLARESELETLKLPAKRKMDFRRCENPVFDQFIGPEDPRLFFTNIGQPLLIYSQTGRTPNVCRAIFIIDARVVVPGLDETLKKAGWNPPIEFKEQTDLIREDQSNIEKNWSPFLGEKDELFFHVSLVPQQIYKWVPGLTLRALDPAPPAHNCLTEIIGADMHRTKFHHATPLLRATLCRRGECVPDVHNTVLIGIIHVKYHPDPYLYYERRVVTWNVTSPYEYLSVSKPLTFSGTNQADPIFTVSMSWDHPSEKHGLGLNHGFLDDVLITSFGVYDYGSAYIDVLARDMLTDHTLCEGTKPSTLW